jgi:hypothetical protein
MASLKGRAWTAVRSTLQHYPAVSRPLWKAYYQVYPREIHGMRDGELNNREIVFGRSSKQTNGLLMNLAAAKDPH